MLLRNGHFNVHLQRHFNKYGEKDLVFSVIEFCEENKMEEREIFWIKKLDSIKNGFNLSEGGKLKDYISHKFSFENIKTGEILLDISAKALTEKDPRIDLSGVYKVVHGRNHSTHGWKILGRKTVRKPSLGYLKVQKEISLKNINTGEERSFPSLIGASRALGISFGSLSHLGKGNRSRCGEWTLSI